MRAERGKQVCTILQMSNVKFKDQISYDVTNLVPKQCDMITNKLNSKI